jgi:dinuclear metal center YbgI/SA1388 family protein
MAYPTIRDVAGFLEQWAPKASAQSYDNVGLLVGDANRAVEKAVIALDLTAQVVGEAEQENAGLIITHHPLIFRPLRQVTASGGPGSLVLRLAEARIALYCAHTNLDAAPGGVSFALAEQLGLDGVRFLQPFSETLFKLATFVPDSHFEQVRSALADAGAGRIGAYEACAFVTEGTGFFRPGDQANPFIGARGQLESVRELRLEVEVARWNLERAVQAMKEAHPYEEVAYDVFPIQQPNSRAGFGAIGRLPAPEPLQAFLDRVASRLSAASLNYTGDPAASIDHVAVCGGAGSDLIPAALQAGADAYVTADVSYHKFFDVLDPSGRPSMALIDAGHYQTETVTERLLQEKLTAHFPDVSWIRTKTRTSPIATFVRKE